MRHPGTEHLLDMLTPNPNLPPDLLAVSEQVWVLACALTSQLRDGPELSAGLRHLLEAKDSFVRQALVDGRTP